MKKMYNFAVVKTKKNSFEFARYLNDGLFVHYRSGDYYVIINLNIDELLYMRDKYNLEIISFTRREDVSHVTKDLENKFKDFFRDIPEEIVDKINTINEEIAFSKDKTLKHFYLQRGKINFLLQENQPIRLITRD